MYKHFIWVLVLAIVFFLLQHFREFGLISYQFPCHIIAICALVIFKRLTTYVFKFDGVCRSREMSSCQSCLTVSGSKQFSRLSSEFPFGVFSAFVFAASLSSFLSELNCDLFSHIVMAYATSKQIRNNIQTDKVETKICIRVEKGWLPFFRTR